MNRALLIVTLLASTGVVRAQEQYIPPPIIAPPPWQPFNFQFDRELSDRGHRNKVAGGVLMGFGSAALAVGQVLVIWAATHPDHYQTVNPGEPADRLITGTVYDTGMIAGGAVLAVAGFITNVIGIPVYAVGGSQMKRAHYRLQASGLRLEF